MDELRQIMNDIDDIKQKITDGEYKQILDSLMKISKILQEEEEEKYTEMRINLLFPKCYLEDDREMLTLKSYIFVAKINKTEEPVGLFSKDELEDLFYEKDVVELLNVILEGTDLCFIYPNE